jgi:hypothetical protein
VSTPQAGESSARLKMLPVTRIEAGESLNASMNRGYAFAIDAHQEAKKWKPFDG